MRGGVETGYTNALPHCSQPRRRVEVCGHFIERSNTFIVGHVDGGALVKEISKSNMSLSICSWTRLTRAMAEFSKHLDTIHKTMTTTTIMMNVMNIDILYTTTAFIYDNCVYIELAHMSE